MKILGYETLWIDTSDCGQDRCVIAYADRIWTNIEIAQSAEATLKDVREGVASFGSVDDLKRDFLEESGEDVLKLALPNVIRYESFSTAMIRRYYHSRLG